MTQHTSRARNSNSDTMIDAAVAAAVELGQAAEALKISWDHIVKAGVKGDKVLKPMQKAARAAQKTIMATMKKVTGSKKRKKTSSKKRR